jgi:hypothetical protein
MFQFVTSFAAAVAGSCAHGSFLNFPTWYEYLPGQTDGSGICTPQIVGLSDVLLIGAAVLDILLRVAAIAAVVYIIYGGIMYTTSQGEPDKTQKAKMTIINALGGLVIAIMATAIVTFLAGSIH